MYTGGNLPVIENCKCTKDYQRLEKKNDKESHASREFATLTQL